MGTSTETSDHEQTRAALNDWRQGDFALGVGGFVHVECEEDGLAGTFDVVNEEEIQGVVLVSQTCDVVNYSVGKEFVTVCPLVEVSRESLRTVASGRTPTYAPIKKVPNPNLVADLTRMMTVSKELLATWDRQEGFDTDQDREKFAFALERKHGRFAFPDDFAIALDGFRRRILSKHARDSDLGRIYRSIREVRVRAAPAWEADRIELAFLIILEDSSLTTEETKQIRDEIEDQIGSLELPDRYNMGDPEYEIATLDDFTARDYALSQQLDFAFLTIMRARPQA